MDANAKHKVFGSNRISETGVEFFCAKNGDIKCKTLKLVVGGKLTEELIKDGNRILEWLAVQKCMS